MHTITADDAVAPPFYVERRLQPNGAGAQLYLPKRYTAQTGFPLDPGYDHVAVAVPDGCVVVLPERPRTPLRIEISDLTRIDG